MDPVSSLLVEREGQARPLLPWVVLALTLHAGAVVTTLMLSTGGRSRPAKLPAVSVRLVRPLSSAAPGPAAGRAQAAPKPAPPQAKPKPSPPPVALKEPKKPQQAASAKAMPAPKTTATPVPEEPPPEVGGGAGGSGIALGNGAPGGAPGIPSDFQFSYYVERMMALVEARWYKPPTGGPARARVRFSIGHNGRLSDIALEESSGVSAFDRAALRALYAANPLPPLPPAYSQPSLTVHLTFTE